MSDVEADVAVLGAGFGGCVTALILNRIGLRPVVIDRGSHPRFAIGESSTPIADMVLRDLSRKYDLPRLEPLTAYGTWQQTYPEIPCGLKRGFSYFHHEKGQQFQPRDDHGNVLLVAASSDDEHSDTHWLRADVDAFFAAEVERSLIPLLENTSVTSLTLDDYNNWILKGHRFDEPLSIRCRFVIDATGSGGLLARALDLPVQTDGLCTHSRAIYGHFAGVKPWHDYLKSRGENVADHPFYCDHAAVHQLFDDGWMWQLRFNNGITSAGFVLETRKRPVDIGLSPEEEWQILLKDSPALAEQFEQATLVQPVTGLHRTDRLQRRTSKATGANWALLPNTAGFVDPLHSTGIAQTLCGIERLTAILDEHWSRDDLDSQLKQYEETVLSELDLIDQLVGGCYDALSDFRLFATYSMLYFAAATTYEHRRSDKQWNNDLTFLCANDAGFRDVVNTVSNQLQQLMSEGKTDSHSVSEFEQFTAEAIEPFNVVGLCDPTLLNMYRYTAAPK